jgi:uncharacterized cupin superfamily protein
MQTKVVRLLRDGDLQNGMEPSHMTPPEDFIVANPRETIHTPFTNVQGNVTAGVWECSPCRQEIERYGVDEFCTVLSGSLTITNADGHAEIFGPGDSFVMPQDFKGIWHITETLRKFWMIVEPPA